MSSELPEPDSLGSGSPQHRALVFAVLDLATGINTAGQTAAELIGVNQTDLICLNVLFRQGAMTAGQLAAAVGLSTGATTTAIDRLERAGYVHRQSDTADRRRVLVEPSRHGARQAFALYDDLIDATARLSATYTDEQLTLLLDVIDRFKALIGEHTDALRARARGNRPT